MTEQLSHAGPPGSFPKPGSWQQARVTDIRRETPTAKTFRLALSEPTAYLAGQHFLVRLTDPDGYRAQRSYSVASAPDDSGAIELTVERLAGRRGLLVPARRGHGSATSWRCAGPSAGGSSGRGTRRPY